MTHEYGLPKEPDRDQLAIVNVGGHGEPAQTPVERLGYVVWDARVSCNTIKNLLFDIKTDELTESDIQELHNIRKAANRFLRDTQKLLFV